MPGDPKTTNELSPTIGQDRDVRVVLDPPALSGWSLRTVWLLFRICVGAAIVAFLLYFFFTELGLVRPLQRFQKDSDNQTPARARSQPARSFVPNVVKVSSTSPRQLELERLVKSNPCNQPATLELIQSLSEAYDFQAAAQLGENFLSRCDREGQIGFATMESWYRLSEFEKALSVLDRFPDETAYYTDLASWRGFVLEKLERYEEAGIAYERALYTFNDLSRVGGTQFYYATRAYKAAKKYCRALRPLELFLSFDPAARSTPDVVSMMQELRQLGSCEPDKPSRKAIKLQRADGVLHVKASINGTPVTMILDTGASAVVLTKDAARRVGLQLNAANTVKMTGINGVSSAYFSEAEHVGVGAAVATDVVVLVDADNTLALGADGLLGQTFLARFKVTVEGTDLRLEKR